LRLAQAEQPLLWAALAKAECRWQARGAYSEVARWC
jgi:hypothetical protein